MQEVLGGYLWACDWTVPGDAPAGMVYDLTCSCSICNAPIIEDGFFSVAHVEYTDTAKTGGVPVPYSWLKQYFPSYVTQAGNDYNAAATNRLSSGYTLWQAYLAGITTETDVLRITSFRLDGNTPVVTFSPSNADARVKYSLYGVTNLSDKAWTTRDSGHRFFRAQAVWQE